MLNVFAARTFDGSLVFAEEDVISYLYGDILSENSEQEDSSEENDIAAELGIKDRSRRNVVQFSTGKLGHTSKDRRYVPTLKKSDLRHRIHSKNGKGSQHRKEEIMLNINPY